MSAFVVARSYDGPAAVAVEQREVPPPPAGRVVIAVRAAGMNPYDVKRVSGLVGRDETSLPIRPGSEVSGVITAIGDDARGAVGPLGLGQEVVASPVVGGYAAEVTAKSDNVFPKPGPLSFAQSANLLAAGSTAIHLLTATGVGPGATVLVHGASGGVGTLLVQLARLRGATRVIGTCGAANDALVARLGAEPVRYGPGLADRVRALAPGGVSAALDCAGTAEAREVSMALVDEPARAATIVDFSGAFAAAGGQEVGSGPGPGAAVRAAARAELVALADDGRLEVVVAGEFPLAEAARALALLAAGHSGGALALVP